ncbi:cardiolipin synthase [Robiginitomaculum antarcticum]|uniref:cardiolipin synthase n=1 Tax=Robiginitomaculum antarcticum TaxID=437507 RepID=UPI00037C79AB|nr:cardiolipin synthase [Robiginitomaculum antarcticum]
MLAGFNIFLALHILIAFGVVLRLLSREHLSPIKRLAWLLVIFVFPMGGLMLYVFFGEARLLNIREKHDKIFEQVNKLSKDVIGDMAPLADIVDASHRPPFQYAQSINGFGLTLGNRAELMEDAQSARARIIKDIDAAKKTVDIIYYIWLGDETGTQTADALIRAAERGVTCRVMADGLGSRKMAASKLWKKMEAAGVNVSVALPLTQVIRTLFLSRIDLRNHRKITVIDGTITYCGSQNCADKEFRPKKKFAPWVDIMLRLEGPVAAQNRLLFASDWMLNEDTPLKDFTSKVKPLKGGIAAQVWGDGPVDRLGATPQLFTTLINSTLERIIISTPYFVPEETVLGALYSAAHRGLDVTIIFPNRNDSWIVRAASQSYYLELLEAGVKVFEYEGGLLHAKTVTVDDSLTMIGSSNIDMRSFDLNYENNMLLYDKKLTKAVIARQQSYINSSRAVSLDEVSEWSLPKRIWMNLVAALGPVL